MSIETSSSGKPPQIFTPSDLGSANGLHYPLITNGVASDIKSSIGNNVDPRVTEKERMEEVLGHSVEILYGNFEILSKFVANEPQRDVQGRLKYLLTGGLAVEAITGESRYHHDTDLVIFGKESDWQAKYLADYVDPERYWAGMNFDSVYLEQTAWTAKFKINDRIMKF